LADNDFGDGFGVARPLWLKLFGPNGPTTIAELRAALLTAPIGDGIGDGSFLARLQGLVGLPARPVTHGLDQNPDAGIREQAILAAAVVTGHDLAAAPAPGIDWIDGIAPAATPSPAEGAVNLAGDESGRSASLYLNGVVSTQSLAGGPLSPFAHLDLSTPYMLLGDLQTGLVVDTRNKTLLQGGPGDYPLFGAGPNDTVELNGDYSAGFGLNTPDYVEQIVARAGNDYNLIADDSNVAAGGTLTVNAMPLGDANHILFDGSAETDGRFLFYGSDAGDMFLGGAGDDRIYGLGGGDVLGGGGGHDTFVYYDAAHSSGTDYDVLADFDPTADKIDLEVTVTGFDAAIQSGTLSTASFNADLGATLAGLGAGHAVYYAPNAGDLAGNVFLIVDANGIAGYQEGEDYVFAIGGAPLADLTGHTGFFI
jgi:Ca2+-binding RTX toxin-like protein